MTKQADDGLETGSRVQVIWDDEDKTIIRFIFEAHWTWDELIAAQQTAYELAATVRYKIGVIMVEAPTLSPDIMKRTRDFSLFNDRHANVDIFVFVVRTTILRSIISLTLKLYLPAASLVVAVSTLEEARATVKQRLTKLRSFKAV